MDKLKTLKELEVDDRLFQKAMIESNLIPIRMNKSDIEGTFFELTKPFVMSSELRQEAIKWIKEMGFDMATSSDKYANYLQGKIDMLAEFCNITKKDIELSAKTKEK